MRKLFFKCLSLAVLSSSPCLSFAQDDEIENYDHSSYLALRIMVGTPSADLKPGGKLNEPNIASGYGVGLEGAWLFHRYLGLYGSLNYSGYKGVAPEVGKVGEFFNPISKGIFNRQSIGAGLLFSLPFKLSALELKVGLDYASVHGLNKKPFIPFGDPEYRLIRYEDRGLWNNIGLQFRIDKEEKVNLAFFAEYKFRNGFALLSDHYSSGVLKSKIPLQYALYEFGIIITYNYSHSKKSIFHKRD